jgi:hypothetical protein
VTDDAGSYADLRRELGMLAERFHRLAEGRLRQPLPPFPSRAEAGRSIAQALADAAYGIEQRNAPAPPAWRDVPRAGAFAVADQITVTGNDLLAALCGVPESGEVWTRDGRCTAREVVAAIREAMLTLRLTV